jgi:hypothetical protein
MPSTHQPSYFFKEIKHHSYSDITNTFLADSTRKKKDKKKNKTAKKIEILLPTSYFCSYSVSTVHILDKTYNNNLQKKEEHTYTDL